MNKKNESFTPPTLESLEREEKGEIDPANKSATEVSETEIYNVEEETYKITVLHVAL